MTQGTYTNTNELIDTGDVLSFSWTCFVNIYECEKKERTTVHCVLMSSGRLPQETPGT
jgi:hypothetical protein